LARLYLYPRLEQLYELLKALEETTEEKTEIAIAYIDENFSEEITDLAFEKGYIAIEVAPEGCPPEADGVYLTPRGKKTLKRLAHKIKELMEKQKKLEEFVE
jgi:DNA-binding PadR family transcriptional regulator